MKPHKHAELIKQWADGAEIEIRCRISGSWFETLNNMPNWYEDGEYRIKPERKSYRVAELNNYNGPYLVVITSSGDEVAWQKFDHFSRWITDRIYYD